MNRILRAPVGQTQAERANKASSVSGSFLQMLENMQNEESEIHFSKHALERLANRHVTLAAGDMQKLNSAVVKAAGHGLHDSLVLLGSLAFIVDVPGKTVVTAMQMNDRQDQIFTNIDGAVIA